MTKHTHIYYNTRHANISIFPCVEHRPTHGSLCKRAEISLLLNSLYIEKQYIIINSLNNNNNNCLIRLLKPACWWLSVTLYTCKVNFMDVWKDSSILNTFLWLKRNYRRTFSTALLVKLGLPWFFKASPPLHRRPRWIYLS